MTRQQEARDSFLVSIERERDVTQLQFCQFTEGMGRVTWRSQVDKCALLAMSLATSRNQDESRRRLRDQLIQIAGAAWRAARDLGVEDEIPF